MNAHFDNSLSGHFSELVNFCSDAIDWNTRAAASSHRLKLDAGDNKEFFLKARLAAKKLHQSAQRPPCVGVFGPSQAGKSYLVSALARPESGPLTVQFQQKDVDFLQQINPGGGRESTGVVTRFSLHAPRVTDADFPVEVRLLSESDILKILFNSFFSDLDHTGSLKIEKLTNTQINQTMEELSAQASRSDVSGSLNPEDVLDLRDYLDQSYRSLTDNLSASFWNQAIDLVPRLTLNQRTKLFGVVWRNCDLFSELYLQLSQAISNLGQTSECLIPLSALIATPDSPSIVDAQLLAQIGKPTASMVSVRPVKAGSVLGDVISVPKPIIAALTAELRLTIKQARWDFLKSSDILDFPGARSRLRETDVQRESHDGKSMAAEFLLRGKVAYLFHRYTMDHELSAVILCVPWGPQEVTGYAPLIDQWVKENQGANPLERAKRPPGLLLTLTKFDQDLQAKGGDNENTERLRWPDRVKSSLLERFGAMDWVEQWDQKSFRNTFWLRNPEIKDSPYMQYQNGKEVGINPDQIERLARLKGYFLEDALVAKHFDDPAQKWDAAMTPQDGGIRAIVACIQAAADPTVHWNGLKSKLEHMIEGLDGKLSQYFNDSQDQEIAKKKEIFNQIKNELARIIKGREIWHLFDLFLPTSADLRALYFSVAKESKEIQLDESKLADEENFDLDAFFEQEIVGKKPGADQNQSTSVIHHRALAFSQRSTELWISQMRSRAQQESTGVRLAANLKTIQALIEELALATNRLGLSQKIAASLSPAENNAGVTWEAIADRQVNIIRNALGEFLAQLGMAELPLLQRPGIPPDQPVRRVFEPYRTHGDQGLPLTEQPKNIPSLVAIDWLVALQKLIMDNAGFAGQDSLSPELNSALGQLVERIDRVETASAGLTY